MSHAGDIPPAWDFFVKPYRNSVYLFMQKTCSSCNNKEHKRRKFLGKTLKIRYSRYYVRRMRTIIIPKRGKLC